MALIGVNKAARILGVVPRTIERYAKAGTLKPDAVTVGGHRRFDETKVRKLAVEGLRKCRANAETSHGSIGATASPTPSGTMNPNAAPTVKAFVPRIPPSPSNASPASSSKGLEQPVLSAMLE